MKYTHCEREEECWYVFRTSAIESLLLCLVLKWIANDFVLHVSLRASAL